MPNSQSNATLDRLYRHMAWANQYMFARLLEIPESALFLTSENEEWSISVIVEHLVRSAGSYAARVAGQPWPTGVDLPKTHEDLTSLANKCADFDAQLRELAAAPEAMTTFIRDGRTIHRARSTILGQSIHHATEHRAQIAGILSLRGLPAIDLDEMDVWAYSDAEGLGN